MTDQEKIDKIHKYFKYNYSGVVTNVHGQYTMNFAGSDFDGDIIFSTNNPQVIKGAYRNEKVTAYDVPKPKKKANLTDYDLYESDTFSFGQQIGPLTNICTSIYAMLPLFKEDSEEYKVLISRIKQCCVNQSKQIDKTKLGQDVKCIVPLWKKWQRIDLDNDTTEEIQKKNFYNSIIADKKPYFFKYKYKPFNKEITEYTKKHKEIAELKFGKTLENLLNTSKEKLTDDESEFLSYYKKYYPAIDTDCTMNKLCKYIEGIDFHIKQKVRNTSDFDYKVLLSKDFTLNKKLYQQIKKEVESTFKEWAEKTKSNKTNEVAKSLDFSGTQAKFERETECNNLKAKLEDITSNEEQLANHLVYLFYVDRPSFSKSTLWMLVGRQLYENIKAKHDSFNFPVKDKNGAMEFLYEKYQIVNLPVPEPQPKALTDDSIENDEGNSGYFNYDDDIEAELKLMDRLEKEGHF